MVHWLVVAASLLLLPSALTSPVAQPKESQAQGARNKTDTEVQRKEPPVAEKGGYDPAMEQLSPYDVHSGSFKRVAYWFSGQPLNETEYVARNWMWIRCRTWHVNMFDVGGRWTERNMEAWKRTMKKYKCFDDSWVVKYYNGLGWGDADVTFALKQAQCTQRMAVEAALKAAAPYLKEDKREMHIWNCIDWKKHPNFGDEMEVMRWQYANPDKDGNNGMVGGGMGGGGRTGYRGPFAGVLGNTADRQNMVNGAPKSDGIGGNVAADGIGGFLSGLFG